jgi:hypothetical protein
MPYDYPIQLAGTPVEDLERLWDAVWRIVDQLNQDEEARRLEAAGQQGRAQLDLMRNDLDELRVQVDRLARMVDNLESIVIEGE